MGPRGPLLGGVIITVALERSTVSEEHTSVAVSRTIDAPAGVLFAILTHSANHAAIDGSAMVREAPSDTVLSGVGDVFTMRMHNDEMGDYEMDNHVVEYEVDRRVAWEPVLRGASRPEDQSEIGVRAHHRWTFDLDATGPDSTLVTETFDCTRSPEWLRKAVRGGERWVDSMSLTLEKLEQLTRT
jgi:hypothetical protein